MAYCANCGTELTGGRACPDCGVVDEECEACGTAFVDNSWVCLDCSTPRNYCPECGTELTNGTCLSCGAERPPRCEDCRERIPADASECPHCGHAPGKTTGQVGLAIQALGGLILAYGIYDIATFTSSVQGMPASPSGTGPAVTALGGVYVVLAVLFVGGGWVIKRHGRANSPSDRVSS